jgi:hypothetical protein
MFHCHCLIYWVNLMLGVKRDWREAWFQSSHVHVTGYCLLQWCFDSCLWSPEFFNGQCEEDGFPSTFYVIQSIFKLLKKRTRKTNSVIVKLMEPNNVPQWRPLFIRLEGRLPGFDWFWYELKYSFKSKKVTYCLHERWPWRFFLESL